MANFVKDLWESIFTPGPTPSLLVATNVSFACLQAVLLVLLAVTYSVHFIVLSFLCGCLWWAINWFVAELRANEERETLEKSRLGMGGGGGESVVPGPSEDSETEVETGGGTGAATSGRRTAKPASASGSGLLSGSREIEVAEAKGELKHLRPASEIPAGMTSSVSTEDEWERVSENENDKDK